MKNNIQVESFAFNNINSQIVQRREKFVMSITSIGKLHKSLAKYLLFKLKKSLFTVFQFRITI